MRSFSGFELKWSKYYLDVSKVQMLAVILWYINDSFTLIKGKV